MDFPKNKLQKFSESKFYTLMKKRVMEVLLICSEYDYFILEEDGRIEERIINEYYELNLRYPPHINRVSNEIEAFKALENKYFDLIITMLNTGDSKATFELGKKIKEKYNAKPVVVLANFSREANLKLENKDFNSVDYIFAWLGNADILLAIIKLIEDRMNIDDDTNNVGVQTIILVEDSIKYYSMYLPIIYKTLMKQTNEIIQESLNIHHKYLRLRARPKILLVNTYEDAIFLYQKYKKTLLGIISDISYNRNGKIDPEAGLKLCSYISKNTTDIPILVQSSDNKYKEKLENNGFGFINKGSKTLLNDFQNYIKFHFGFGYFIFKNPENDQEIARALDLKEMQKKLLVVPMNSIIYHAKNNHFSRWLRTRTLFSLANLFRPRKIDEFKNPERLRDYLVRNIKIYRKNIGQGIISNFRPQKFDESLKFSRIGNGSLGGKARGLAFIDHIIKKHDLTNKFEKTVITIPQTVVIATDLYEEFMNLNDLYNRALKYENDEDVLKEFIECKLPGDLKNKLRNLLQIMKKPLAVRSSSLFEDSQIEPFAGVYSTYMISNIGDLETRLTELCCAVKSVYASVFYNSSKRYITATNNNIDEEKMGIIIQEIIGNSYKGLYYPAFSGVIKSINFYPFGREKSQDGIVNIAVGFGKTVVGGESSLRFSPKYPQNIIQLSSVEMALKETQNKLYTLKLLPNTFQMSVDDSVTLEKVDIHDVLDAKSFAMIFSTYDNTNNVIRDNFYSIGSKVVTFGNILKRNMFPLVGIINMILPILKKAMNTSIEIEFSVALNEDKEDEFNLLQIRPIINGYEDEDMKVDIDDIEINGILMFSNSALGNGKIEDIYDVVYVKPESFNTLETRKIAEEVNKLNRMFEKEDKRYILIGPGRWGSADPFLGIPVKWQNISMAKLIVETSHENLNVKSSQGSHFFQNLTSFRVSYFTVNVFNKNDIYDVDFLDNEKSLYEDKYIKHICFNKPLTIKIDGKNNKGVIFKPN